MIVVIFNEMPFPIHVTVVRPNPGSMRFVFSKRQVPIPGGKIVGRMDVGVGEAVQTTELPKDIRITCAQDGLGDDIGIYYEYGTAEDGTYLKRFHVRPPAASMN